LKKRISLLIFSLFASSGAQAHTKHHHHHVKEMHVSKLNGVASYYGKGFFGHKTASGTIMHHRDMTAANRTLPLGTLIRVTNKDNGKSVVVTVNDRGPYVGHRILDLAERPATMLGMKESGTAHVSITPISYPASDAVEVAEAPGPRRYRPIHHHT